MSLDPVILGFLREGAQTGYQLKKRMDRSVANFWTISFGGLYPVLKKMAAQEEIEENKELVSNKRGVYYQLTKKGQTKFEKWLKSDYKQLLIKDEFLLKIFFANETELIALLSQIKQRLSELESVLENLETLIDMDQKKELPGMTTGKRMTLQLGFEQNKIEYNHLQQLQAKISEKK